MSDAVIKVEGLYKKFCSSLKHSMAYGAYDVARSMCGVRYENKSLRKGEFWALQDIHFELKRGETLGLIGRNGSGKTTLLRMINGIFPPDKGAITINGRIAPLIAVGAGFHPHLTGRENIYLNGAILGMNKKGIKQKFDSIVAFAEIGEFIDAPVATYSSGMTVRLGFAIAIHSDIEILLVDEIMAVGDMRFQQKCLQKFSEVIKNGTSIIFVSHNELSIQSVCKWGLLLDKGVQIDTGEVLNILYRYHILTSERALAENNTSIGFIDAESHIKEQNHNIRHKYLTIYNAEGNPTTTILSGESIVLEWKYDVKKALHNVTFGVFFIDDSIRHRHGYSSCFDKQKVPLLDNSVVIRLHIDNMFLRTGAYRINIGLYDENFVGVHYWDWNIGTLIVKPSVAITDNYCFKHSWEFVAG
ncbi:MAG: ABC transporter ATP-binding protein [Pseudomonadota bacterium]